jgi:peptide chain release factor subunit 1
VATITEDTVRALSAFRGTEAPVTTCYLDVDGRHLTTHRDVQHEFELLVRRAGVTGVNGHTHPSVIRDVGRMERHVRGYKRARARGLAMFSCSAQGLWEVLELPATVTSQLLVNDAPCVRQLEDVVDQFVRLGVLLTDRQRARILVYEQGDVVDRLDVVDPLERQGGDARGELVKTRVSSQRQQQARQHVKNTAQQAFDVFQRVGFDRLVIAAPTPDVLSDLEQVLHPYLRERVADRLQLPIAIPDEQLHRVVRDAEAAIERRDEADLVTRLRAGLSTKAKSSGVSGLAATLRALGDRRAERLLVSRGYAAEGWQCASCGALAMVGRRCPSCGEGMRHVDDVVEQAVELALAQHCRVNVLVNNADLDVLGRIGALLRF